MSTAGKAVGGGSRLRVRPRDPTVGYAFCPDDRFWFRPAYTEGKCPLCGEVAPDGAAPSSRLAGIDRSWLGVGGLALLSVAMLALVLYMYFRG
ncbi:MAG TPA: hypothetical protein VG369_12730 [Humibacter sp.]|nr:hypothetical protein [Humibacter sp.]